MSVLQLFYGLLASAVAGMAANVFVKGRLRPQGTGAGKTVFSASVGFCLSGFVFGSILMLCGSPVCAAVLTGIAVSALAVASNAKYAVLYEPLVFSDLFLLKYFIRHPCFYIFAISPVLRVGIAAGLIIMLTLLVMAMAYASLAGHVAGLMLAALFFVILLLFPVERMAPVPDVERDIVRFGLGGCLFIYWRRWRRQSRELLPPAHMEPLPAQPGEVIVIVQCESFADPQTLALHRNAVIPPMSGLEQARARASQYGSLNVSGFGAYTLRTEYAVLSGKTEEELGFRRFDPFLTALQNADQSLPSLLGRAGFRTIYMHPYDLHFGDRITVMPGMGFSETMGCESFGSGGSGTSVYVNDRELADKILYKISKNSDPLFLYAVSIENHGPWNGKGDPVACYLSHLENSDAMIGQLIEGLDQCQRPARLIVLGDHRPSIPGATSPEAGRDTPYVVVDFPSDQVVPVRSDIPPEALFRLALNRESVGNFISDVRSDLGGSGTSKL
ncbi:capsule polysaccharide biosynthesis protein [Acetobacter aceti NRIC 0242]|uniref:Sulfatase n=1 Tax=Acetobacter aceti NBRC 14818 TaxID=887700 RepID=A0AB33II46_ACEAC|nr:LTA synthase family protein [Acetobacter aceti]TCS34406.1 sulfatase-like protein [Acetobacter aceti NBRC 14818]BCK76832.1 sulfatase [Acetobacter aceti NBRC 14818]GAN58108.1 capsule polysaccharide biosynthesis protein [Acetobacter aceti NBRC 14818]GBO79756.1 capsule polysaccharide biosynthesis protein [Acetobacter aceti NRIC 0242]